MTLLKPKQPEFFLQNLSYEKYETVKKFKNFMQNFNGVNGPAKTISAGSLAPPKRFQRGQ
jgi:hypothetical protein